MVGRKGVVMTKTGKGISASKAVAIIRILSTPGDRDPRFIEYVVNNITRGKKETHA